MARYKGHRVAAKTKKTDHPTREAFRRASACMLLVGLTLAITAMASSRPGPPRACMATPAAKAAAVRAATGRNANPAAMMAAIPTSIPVMDVPAVSADEPAETLPEPTPEPSPEVAEDAFEHDVDSTAAVIYHEAWDRTTERHKLLVGAVVYNRRNSPRFPDTVDGVIMQKNQYYHADVDRDSEYMTSAQADPEIWAECRRLARLALTGQVDCPPDVVFQANFVQGEVYETFDTPYSTTWFCYG